MPLNLDEFKASSPQPQSLNLDQFKQTQDPNRPGGEWSGVLTELARPAQLIGDLTGRLITHGSNQAISNNDYSLATMSGEFIKKAHSEADPTKKSALLKQAREAAGQISRDSRAMFDLDNQIKEAERINIPLFGTVKPIDTEKPLGETIQRDIAGPAMKTAAWGLGPVAGGGAFFGGQQLETGEKVSSVRGAVKFGGATLLGMIFGEGLKLVAPVIGKGLSKIPGAEAVGGVIEKAGQAAEGFLDQGPNVLPQAFTKGVEKGATALESGLEAGFEKIPGVRGLGLRTGAIEPNEKDVAASQKKIEDYWQRAKNRYQASVRYDEKSPEILGREGVIPDSQVDVMLTGNKSKVMKMKISAENKTLNELLDSTGSYGSLTTARAESENLINANFKGIERQQALDYMDKQLTALEGDYADVVVAAKGGENKLAVGKMNEMKSYLYSQGYSSKLAPKSDQINARAARLVGRAFRTTIENSLEDVAPELTPGALPTAGLRPEGTKQAIINLNQRIGDLSEAVDFLDHMNGKRLPFGRLGRYFARTTGAMVGSGGGIPGEIAGLITADKLIDILQNPKYTVGQAEQIIAKAQQEAPEALQRAINQIDQNITTRMNRAALPESSGRPAFPAAEIPKLDPATQRNLEQDFDQRMFAVNGYENVVKPGQVTDLAKKHGISEEQVVSALRTHGVVPEAEFGQLPPETPPEAPGTAPTTPPEPKAPPGAAGAQETTYGEAGMIPVGAKTAEKLTSENLNHLNAELEAITQAINDNPAKGLEKFSDRRGAGYRLAEGGTGTGGVFGKTGDQILETKKFQQLGGNMDEAQSQLDILSRLRQRKTEIEGILSQHEAEAAKLMPAATAPKAAPAALPPAKNVPDPVEKPNREVLPGRDTTAGQGATLKETTATPEAGQIPSELRPNAKSLPEFRGYKDLTTNILDQLKGRSSVSKQFIEDLTNQGNIKQAERDVIRKTLEDYKGNVPVKEFADKVKTELLPLKRTTRPGYSGRQLPDELIGPVANHTEHVYESPIKTSAGITHQGQLGSSENYFAHTSVEDLPGRQINGRKIDLKPGENYVGSSKQGYYSTEGGTTRRVIELQSDLFQKGRLEGEGMRIRERGENKVRYQAEADTRNAEIAKLEPYRNTWHERIIREEVKQAAKDGKTLLQFPTGETAMKIEGLGENAIDWFTINKRGFAGEKITPESLKVGMETGNIDSLGSIDQRWIITDVLGDGKFKAVPKTFSYPAEKMIGKVEERPEGGGYRAYLKTPDGNEVNASQGWPTRAKAESEVERFRGIYERNAKTAGEEFDISGKVDTNNPIYRFYEKEVGRYLKNKYNAVPVTDKQGVKWWQMDVPKDAAKKPVEAYNRQKDKARRYA